MKVINDYAIIETADELFHDSQKFGTFKYRGDYVNFPQYYRRNSYRDLHFCDTWDRCSKEEFFQELNREIDKTRDYMLSLEEIKKLEK